MPEAMAVEFEAPSGDPLRFEWPPGAFDAIDPSTPPPEPLWKLGGELDWDELEAVRLLTARLGDGRRLAIAALRPAGAAHGEEVVAGAIGDGESFAQIDRPLISAEYGPDGSPRRIGLEIYPEDGGLALRIAGDVNATQESVTGAVRRRTATLSLRGPDGSGAAALDILARA